MMIVLNRYDITEQGKEPVAGIHLDLDTIPAKMLKQVSHVFDKKKLKDLIMFENAWCHLLVNVSHFIIFHQ